MTGSLHADTEHQRVGRQYGLIERVVKDDSADLSGTVGVAVHELEQSRAQVIDDPSEIRAGTRGAAVLHGLTVDAPHAVN
ncbi:hypothetical protein GCM10023191_023860 [Actinoallomurus oryzae]|uniref:Uncharacterized protein n=1 Tax=Actinoallomurus oryzae TaxID=502180 RepID=A0ABP8PT32_9ACTN